MENKRDNFNSKLGIVAAAAGSAVGLGNIWKFPYITGRNGGGAFLIVYLICVICVAVPLVITEFALGRKTHANAMDTYKELAPNTKWYISGAIAIITAFVILAYYAIIAGWIFNYTLKSLTGQLMKVAPAELGNYFGGVISNPVSSLAWNALVLGITVGIVVAGVQNGIEKYTKVLMPLLFVLLIVLMVRSVTLPGASEGIKFLFKPDFSNLKGKSVLEALGHSFYSLSIAMGILITYGSYIKKDENIIQLSGQVAVADTVVALMAGTVIFPAVFAYGFEPDAGPTLIFQVLPAVFEAMPLGRLFSTLFFVLVGIAAITSTISLLEVVVAFVTENFKLDRKKAAIILGVLLFLLSIPSTLSFGAWSNVKIFGLGFFDLFDFVTSNICLPVVGILECIFVAHVWGVKNAISEMTSDGMYKFNLDGMYNVFIKFVAPVVILIIFLNSTNLLTPVVDFVRGFF